MNVYITIGISGSGKSEHRRDDCLILNKDQLRFMLYNFDKTGIDYVKENEQMIQMIAQHVYLRLLKNGHDIYVDETNLTPKKPNEIERELRYKIVLRKFEA